MLPSVPAHSVTDNTFANTFLSTLVTEGLDVANLKLDELKKKFEQWWTKCQAWGYEDADKDREKREYNAAWKALKSYQLPPLLQHPLRPEFGGIYLFPGILAWKNKVNGLLLQGAQYNGDGGWTNNDTSSPWGDIRAEGGRVYAFEERPVTGGRVIGRKSVIPRDKVELDIQFAARETLKAFVLELMKLPFTVPGIGINALIARFRKSQIPTLTQTAHS